MKQNKAAELVFDVSAEDFEARVLDASRSVPVLVDFWASWCAPCRILGPALEGVVRELDGAVRLAKVDTEQQPTLAAAFEIRGIPAVKLFREGRLVDEFTGARSADEIRRFLAPHVPSPAADLVARADALRCRGDAAGAERAYGEALAKDVDSAHAKLGLAMALIDLKRADEAVPWLEQAADDEATGAEARAALSRIRFVNLCGDGDEDRLRRLIDSDPDNLEARVRLGYCRAARGAFREALEEFLRVVDGDPKFDDEAGRRAMLEVFEAVGPRSELAEEYRTRLSRVLFR